MERGFFIGFIFFIVAIILLIGYWFIPFQELEFGGKITNPNFNLNSSDLGEMQFYPAMRFPNPEISYKIHECTLQKKHDMERAFEIISNITILDFNPVDSGEEISVFCDSRNKIEKEMFIAGEGGPTNITKTSQFNVILKGRILLIKDFKCDTPNVAIHELIHVLGFDHSKNKQNVMYNITKCGQQIGDDIPFKINQLYSIPSAPDLAFENVSAMMKGKYLITEIKVRNNGLARSERTPIRIYADGDFVKEIYLDSLDVGFGKIISLENIWIAKLSIDELKFVLDVSQEDLIAENNIVILKIKK